jgi:phosphoribosylamine---glycine ligase
MKLLVIGSGAREHAICEALTRDASVSELHCAPGNPGIAKIATVVPVDITDPSAIADLAELLGSELVIIGPEGPLVAGTADAVRAKGTAVFGPSALAAQLEGSKAFAKEIMAAAGVPTAESRTCHSLAEVADALDLFGPPYVVKDDGLAAGKGVVVTNDREEALTHAEACSTVVVESYLDGPEVSLFAITDGTHVLPLEPAQDFKRVRDGDAGPNTGGMGAYSPLPWAPTGLTEEVLEKVLRPTVAEMSRRGTPFIGLLYAGLALTSRGMRVVEFNARFGDPETQVVLARLKTPLAGLLMAAATDTLEQHPPLEWSSESAVTVVLASPGYPETPDVGGEVTGISEAEATGALIFHAGTSLHEGSLISSGGRVLSVTATGPSLSAARERVYDAIARIHLVGGHFRSDIALDAAGDSPAASETGRMSP